jgi:uncharacterized protein (DUF58 family)
MDFTKIKRKTAATKKTPGVYADLDDLIRIQFKARDFSFLPHQPVNSVLSGRYSSRLRGRGLNFEELRHYLPGDDIRTMDWKVTARTRSPYVRVYTEEKDRSVLLVVDQRINMFFGTRDRFKSVTAAELAALALWRAVDVGDRVGALVFNDTDQVETPPQRSRSNVMKILGNIIKMNHLLSADAQVEPNSRILNHALEKAKRLVPHDGLIVVISDFFGADKESRRLIAEIAGHNDIIGILVHDPIRMKPPSDRITLSDGSLQMEVNFTDKRMRKRLVDDYYEEQDHITHFLRKLSAPLLMVSNKGDIVDQVRRLLGVPLRGKNKVE